MGNGETTSKNKIGIWGLKSYDFPAKMEDLPKDVLLGTPPTASYDNLPVNERHPGLIGYGPDEPKNGRYVGIDTDYDPPLVRFALGVEHVDPETSRWQRRPDAVAAVAVPVQFGNNIFIQEGNSLVTNNLVLKGPWADVTAYGATGDGNHNDTPAFMGALATGKPVYVPAHSANTYLLSDPLTIPENGTIFSQAGVTLDVRKGIVFSNRSSLIMENGWVDASAGDDNIAVLDLQASKNATIRLFRLKGKSTATDWDTHPQTGIKTKLTTHCDISIKRVNRFTYAFHADSPGASEWTNNNRFYLHHIGVCKYCFYLDGSVYFNQFVAYMESCGTGISLNGGQHGHWVVHFDFVTTPIEGRGVANSPGVVISPECDYTIPSGVTGLFIQQSAIKSPGTQYDEPVAAAGLAVESIGGRKGTIRADDSGNYIHVGSTTDHNFQVIRNGLQRISVQTAHTGLHGGLSVGDDYVATAPPPNGVIVEGRAGFGHNAAARRIEALDSLDPQLRLTRVADARFMDFELDDDCNLSLMNFVGGTGIVIMNAVRTNNIYARTSDGLIITDKNGALGIFIEDGTGNVGINEAMPQSALHVDGGQTVRRIDVATNYNILLNDYYVGVSDTTEARTMYLPSAATVGSGRVYHVNDESGGAGTNNITIVAFGTETIDGAATYVINTNYGSVSLISDGVNFFTF